MVAVSQALLQHPAAFNTHKQTTRLSAARLNSILVPATKISVKKSSSKQHRIFAQQLDSHSLQPQSRPGDSCTCLAATITAPAWPINGEFYSGTTTAYKSNELEYDKARKDEKHHKRMEHLGEMGALAARAFAMVGGITNWEYVLCASVGRGGAELQVARWRERENDSHAAEHDRSYLRVLGRLAGRSFGSFNT